MVRLFVTRLPFFSRTKNLGCLISKNKKPFETGGGSRERGEETSNKNKVAAHTDECVEDKRNKTYCMCVCVCVDRDKIVYHYSEYMYIDSISSAQIERGKCMYCLHDDEKEQQQQVYMFEIEKRRKLKPRRQVQITHRKKTKSENTFD